MAKSPRGVLITMAFVAPAAMASVLLIYSPRHSREPEEQRLAAQKLAIVKPAGTDSSLADSDGDGLTDAQEALLGYRPARVCYHIAITAKAVGDD